MSPRVGRRSPATHLSSVVLPQPEGPDDADELPVLDDERDVAQRLRLLLTRAVRLREVRDLGGREEVCEHQL